MLRHEHAVWRVEFEHGFRIGAVQSSLVVFKIEATAVSSAFMTLPSR
jgi:hypothetical protein